MERSERSHAGTYSWYVFFSHILEKNDYQIILSPANWYSLYFYNQHLPISTRLSLNSPLSWHNFRWTVRLIYIGIPIIISGSMPVIIMFLYVDEISQSVFFFFFYFEGRPESPRGIWSRTLTLLLFVRRQEFFVPENQITASAHERVFCSPSNLNSTSVVVSLFSMLASGFLLLFQSCPHQEK